MRSLKKQNCSALLHIPIDGGGGSNTDSLQGDSRCPPWFLTRDKERGCEPGPSLGGIVEPDRKTLQSQVADCYCMTGDKNGSNLLLSACLYACVSVSGAYPLPCEVEELENVMCGDLNREGQLCGECKPGFAPPVYSYAMYCVNCTHYHLNWVKYIVVAFGPLTVFYVVIMLLHINVLSPLVNRLLVVLQIATISIQMRVLAALHESGTIVVKWPYLVFLTSIGGISNLDFFRLAYTPFCLHPHMTTLQALALDYIIAVYPLLLILLTYMMVQLYDRNFKPVVWAWKPFSWTLRHFRRQWDVRTSLIDAIASFLFLSNAKLVTVSFDLLVPTRVFHLDGSLTGGNLYLLNAATVEYFGNEHLPYALLSLMILLFLVLLPTALLCLYPWRCFQRLLNHLHLNSHALRTFMDVFQGNYKDGTNGTRDCRCVSGLFFFIPTLLLTMFATALSSLYALGSIIIAIYLTLVLILQPHKRSVYNKIDALLLSCLLLGLIGIMANIVAITERRTNRVSWYISLIILILTATLFLCYLLALVLWCLARRNRSRMECAGCFTMLRKRSPMQHFAAE